MSFLFAWITSLSNTDPTENSSSLFETRNRIFQIKKYKNTPNDDLFSDENSLVNDVLVVKLNKFTFLFVMFNRKKKH